MSKLILTRPAGTLVTKVILAALFGLGTAEVSCAQAPAAPPPPTQPGRPPLSLDAPPQSKVFPEGGFPEFSHVKKGDIPESAKKEATGLAQLLQPPTFDSAPYGYQPPLEQDAPGAVDYRLASSPLPEYVYRPEYYYASGVGAKSIADYAPPGFEARSIEEYPGAPEFTPIGPPVRITLEERQKFVTRGLLPGSFLVPGTNTSFRFRGFARLTTLFDFAPNNSKDDFPTATIPVPQQIGQNKNFTARPSRFGIETWTPTSFLDWNVHTFVEGDFFNGPNQAVGGGGNPFRLRHAWVDFGYFRVGQQNTVFMDANAWPSTVDFAGPRGLLNQRRPAARVTLPICDQWFWAGGVEGPFSDITTNGLGERVQDVPDFATHVRYEADYGHVQLSAVQRTIGYRPDFGEVTRRAGWGLSASTVFHPWALLTGNNPVRKDNPSGLERSRILLMYNYGRGVTRYIQDTAGQGLDGQVDPVTGAFDTVPAAGWSASYEHWFTEKWLTNVTYSPTQVWNNDNQPGETYNGAKYLAASLWWIPIPRLSLGIEYLWGERENLDGQRGRAERINASVQYNF